MGDNRSEEVSLHSPSTEASPPLLLSRCRRGLARTVHLGICLYNVEVLASTLVSQGLVDKERVDVPWQHVEQ